MTLHGLIRFFVMAALLGVSVLACRAKIEHTTPALADTQTSAVAPNLRTQIGFRTHRNLEEHYQKHGREFGTISQDEYLRQAQTLRDRAAVGDILEAVRKDGVTTRFDRKEGTFVAFNKDFTLRTYFKPVGGERYFQRQLTREQ